MREGLNTALVFLTRLPVKSSGGSRLADAAPWFPVVGALIGAAAGAMFGALTFAGMASFPAAILVLAFLVVVTGALHEDGLADCADALGPHDRTRRLEVMRDSRIGTFGTLALVLVMLARLAGLSSLWDPVAQLAVLTVVGATSRGAIVGLMAALPQARADGLAASAGRPDRTSVAIALGLPVLLAFLLLDPREAVVLLLAALVAASAWAWFARRSFGGQTGDVLGTTQQLVEAAMLLTVTTLR